jgi:hypothetical protein
MKINKQKGFGQVFMLITILMLAAIIPLTLNQVQKNQEIRRQAAENTSLPLTPPITGHIMTCNQLRMTQSYYFNSCQEDRLFSICFNKYNGEFIGCDNYSQGKCTQYGANPESSILCPVAIGSTITPTPLPIGSTITPTPLPIPITSGAYLYFDSKDKSYEVGETFQVTIKVNSAKKIISGVDVVGLYDPSRLELVLAQVSPSMVFGNSGFCAIPRSFGNEGKFSFSCGVEDSLKAMAVNGDLVKLTFKTKAVGSAKFKFVCENRSTQESNIIDSKTGVDLINCDKNLGLNIVVVGPNGVNGSCGKTMNSCLEGTLKDVANTDIQFIWQCLGKNGGKKVQCAISKLKCSIYACDKCNISQCGGVIVRNACTWSGVKNKCVSKAL